MKAILILILSACLFSCEIPQPNSYKEKKPVVIYGVHQSLSNGLGNGVYYPTVLKIKK